MNTKSFNAHRRKSTAVLGADSIPLVIDDNVIFRDNTVGCTRQGQFGTVVVPAQGTGSYGKRIIYNAEYSDPSYRKFCIELTSLREQRKALRKSITAAYRRRYRAAKAAAKAAALALPKYKTQHLNYVNDIAVDFGHQAEWIELTSHGSKPVDALIQAGIVTKSQIKGFRTRDYDLYYIWTGPSGQVISTDLPESNRKWYGKLDNQFPQQSLYVWFWKRNHGHAVLDTSPAAQKRYSKLVVDRLMAEWALKNGDIYSPLSAFDQKIQLCERYLRRNVKYHPTVAVSDGFAPEPMIFISDRSATVFDNLYLTPSEQASVLDGRFVSGGMITNVTKQVWDGETWKTVASLSRTPDEKSWSDLQGAMMRGRLRQFARRDPEDPSFAQILPIAVDPETGRRYKAGELRLDVEQAATSAALQVQALELPTSNFNLARSMFELKDSEQTVATAREFLRWLRQPTGVESGLHVLSRSKGLSIPTSGFKLLTAPLRHAASVFLAYKFGIAPTMEDVSTILGSSKRALFGIRRGLAALYSGSRDLDALITVRNRFNGAISDALQGIHEKYLDSEPNWPELGTCSHLILFLEASNPHFVEFNVPSGDFSAPGCYLFEGQSERQPIGLLDLDGHNTEGLVVEAFRSQYRRYDPLFPVAGHWSSRSSTVFAQYLAAALDEQLESTVVDLLNMPKWFSTAWELVPCSFVVDWFLGIRHAVSAVQSLADRITTSPPEPTQGFWLNERTVFKSSAPTSRTSFIRKVKRNGSESGLQITQVSGSIRYQATGHSTCEFLVETPTHWAGSAPCRSPLAYKRAELSSTWSGAALIPRPTLRVGRGELTTLLSMLMSACH